jgi:N-formylglutamate amidohydrolase
MKGIFCITRVIIFCFLAIIATDVRAQPFVTGQTYFGNQSYIEYLCGSLPVIISAPHGGLLEPVEIPDRDCDNPDFTCVTDFNTQELSRAIANSLYDLTGCYPHLIINKLHRKKLDANREIVEAAAGDPIAEQAWYDFHSFIDSSASRVTQVNGKGLYIDLHGHGHSVQRLELGYLLFKSELQLADAVLDLPPYPGYTSILHLDSNNLADLSLSGLLRGNTSLGTMFANKGYPAVPSTQDPFPDGNESYFTGGYNTDRHGSRTGGTIDGIQIECNYNGVRNNQANYERFADSVAIVIVDYLQAHYFNDFYNTQTVLLSGNENVCPGEIMTYAVADVPGANYLWSISGGMIVAGQGTHEVSVQWDDNVLQGIINIAIDW